MTATAATSVPFDAAIPFRDDLLDAAVVRRLLAGSPLARDGAEIGCVRVQRAKYRKGESLRVTYAVGLIGDGGREHRVLTTRTFPDSLRAYERAVAAAPADSPHIFHSPESGSVWWSFPADRRLRGLADTVEPNGVLRGRLGLPGWVATDVVEYAAERSLTVRADGADGPVGFLKTYAPGSIDVPALAARYDGVARGLAAQRRGVVAPRVLGASGDHLALEPMRGSSWDAARPGPDHLGRLGVAIASMHALDPPMELRRFARLDDGPISTAAALVAWARPDLADSAHLLAKTLVASRPAAASDVYLHGDCHPGNGLIGADAIALIDIDQAGHGPASADLGSLAARLHRAAAPGREAAIARVDRLLDAFRGGYRTVLEPPSRADVAWHTAAALLVEQAVRTINRARWGAIATLDDLVVVGQTILDRHDLTTGATR